MLAIGEIFRSRDMIFGSVPLKRIRVVGSTAELTYGRLGEAPIVLWLDVERDASGELKIIGLRGLPPEMLQPRRPRP